MSISAHPDEPCHNCKQRPELRLHPDGSIGSAWHKCPNQPPGPPDPPMRYAKGRFFPKEGANVVWPAVSDHREAPAPTLGEVMAWIEEVRNEILSPLAYGDTHLATDAEGFGQRVPALLRALAERADASEGEPVAWLVEWRRRDWGTGELQPWEFLTTLHLHKPDEREDDERRVVPLYRRAERAEPDGGLREALAEQRDWETMRNQFDKLQLEYVEFRQQLRSALYRVWPNNPGVGNHEIVNAVKRTVDRALASAPQRADDKS